MLATALPAIPWRQAFFTSQTLRRHYLDAGFPAGEGRVIHWGVDADAGGRVVPESDRLGILFVGRLVEAKGVHTLLEALARLPSGNGRPLRVTLVGEGPDGPYLKRLEEQAAVLAGICEVHRPGRLTPEELLGVYREHDILVFPSIWEEPFALTVLEGMAAGLCVVASTAGGTTEVVQGEVNGLTFQPGDAADLARQLQRARDDTPLRVRLADEGRRHVKERFTWDAMVDSVESLLCEAVGRPSVAANLATVSV